MSAKRIEIVVTGRVQGVGFRVFVAREARALGLAGFVRNRDDGAVEIEAEGDSRAIETFVKRIEVGPVAARVTGCERRALEPRGMPDGFEIAATRRA